MIADNFGIKILQVSALAPKDFSQSYLPLSNVCPRHSLTSCVLGNDTGSNTWTPVNDTIDFILRVRSSLLRLSAMTESSFGKIISIKDASGTDISANPVVRTAFTYTGREYEEESGMFYYRARYYSPTTGRFLQSDPDPGKVSSPMSLVNRYSYVGNNPIMATDPTGKLFGIDDIIFGLIIAGGLAQAGMNMNAAQDSGFGSGSWQFWTSGLLGFFTGAAQTAAGIYGGWIGTILGAGIGQWVNAYGNQGITKGFGNIDWSLVNNIGLAGLGTGLLGYGVFKIADKFFMPVHEVLGQIAGGRSFGAVANGIAFTVSTVTSIVVPTGAGATCNPHEDMCIKQCDESSGRCFWVK